VPVKSSKSAYSEALKAVAKLDDASKRKLLPSLKKRLVGREALLESVLRVLRRGASPHKHDKCGN